MSVGAFDEAVAAALSEQRDVIEDVIEPYLIQQGLVLRTPRGRMVAESGYRHLGLTPRPQSQAPQLDFLNEEQATGDG